MSQIKLKVCTFPAKVPGQKYQRNVKYREAYIDLDAEGKVCERHDSAKWKCGSCKDPNTIKDRIKLMEGLVFNSKEDAQKFISKNKDQFDAIAKANPSFECFKPIKIIKRFQPAADKTTVWKA